MTSTSNPKPTPCSHEGMASILLKVVARPLEGRRAWMVPVGIRFPHAPKVETSFGDRLSKLEDRIGWRLRPSIPTDERILCLGTGQLGLKEVEFPGEVGGGDLQQRLASFYGPLLDYWLKRVSATFGWQRRRRSARPRTRFSGPSEGGTYHGRQCKNGNGQSSSPSLCRN